MRLIFRALLFAFIALPLQAEAEGIALYVDKKTKQVFTEPGPGREPLNVQLVPLKRTEDTELKAAEEAEEESESVSRSPAAAQVPDSLGKKKNWYERFSLRGYSQFRISQQSDDDKVEWFHPSDRSVSPDQTFIIRRGRLVLSGDVSDNLFVYLQPDLSASASDGEFSTQLRDLYSDVALDSKKEFRIRVGQSKIPYGFVNMQSSQNRLTIERPDAINSAVEGERDMGAFFYWAPHEIRQRFSNLVRDGLKGSGDYGVFALGAYNGQGLNRSDANDSPHVVTRLSYPFKFPNGQFFEAGIQAYAGKFVPRTREITLEGEAAPFIPEFDENGIQDKRVGISAILYPQPFGIEAEWNWGRGPELSNDYLRIEEGSLNGGYILANLKLDTSRASFYPFIRWHYYEGGRKFGRNAPSVNADEWDFGIEYSPYKELELVAAYTYSNARTNSNTFPYRDLRDESRIQFQVQVNY